MELYPCSLGIRPPQHQPVQFATLLGNFFLGAHKAVPLPQQRPKRWASRKLILLLLGVLLLFQTPAPAQVRGIRRVLIFNELGLWSPGVLAINKEIFAALEKSSYQIEFYSEDLDTSLFPDEASQRGFRDWYFRKYRNRKPDLIIAVGPSPIKFMAESHELFAPGTPIVFWGSTEEFAEPPTLDSDFTGVWGVARPDKTLEAALQLQPNTKHVVVVGGVAPYDRHLEALVRQRLQQYGSKLDFTYLTDFAMPDLLERLKHLPNNTIVYHTSIMEDAAGTHFVDATQSVPMVADAANAPVFVVDDVDVGRGTVGGNVFSFALAGQVAARMAVRVLNGEKPRDIPIVKGANTYMFDWRALKRWGLKERDLPPGSVVLNRQPTVWESYKEYIVGGISLIMAETLLIFGLVWQRTRAKKAESQLAISNDRLRLAVEAGRSVGWDWDIKTGRDRWFGDLETMFGITSDSYTGHVEDFRRRVHPEDRELAFQAVAKARQSREPYIAEFRVVRTDGTVRWITARGKFYYGNNGDAERMLGMAVDITDRKLMEEALRGSEQRLRLAVQAGRMYVYEWDASTDAIVRSAEFADVIGTNQPRQTSRRELIVQVHPDDRERLAEEYSKLSPESPASQLQYRLLHPDGGLQWLERRARAFFDEGGKLQRIIGVVADITDLKEAEHAVRESEQRFRLVANTAPVMIWMSGIDKLCNYFNQPWLDFTGRHLEAELGNGWADIVHPNDFQACVDTYQRAFDRHETFQMQYRMRRHDGEYRWLLDIGVPRFDSNGSFAGYIGSCVDVTDRKMAEEALSSLSGSLIDAQEEERKRIAREIHDDYSQRLALLAIELENLAEENANTSVEMSQRFHQIWNGISEVGADLHSLSHRLHSSTLDSLGLVAGAQAFCKEFAEQQEIQVDFAGENVPRDVTGDAALCLFRIVQEGLRNIKRHSGADRAEVRVESSGEKLHLSVSDRGRGFDVNSHSPRNGIGIRSMEERLRSLGGQLEITSRLKEGTRIDAWLPLTVASRRSA
jgi:PAS domain S-box-containing protein